jgi:hypothetical protein
MAWSIPTFSASDVTAATGTANITLTEPSVTDVGDLLIACIAYRGTNAFTLPAGWNTVATQQSSGNTSTTVGSSIGSGCMAYIVRGASAPSYVFTRTAAGADVALGTVIRYRGGHASAPFDTGSSATLGANSTTVTTASITTAEAGELLVAFAAGADNVTFGAFDAATDPTTASTAGGTAVDTTNAPTNGTWRRRRENITTTGADTGIGIADAVRATAGSTGTVQCTASASSRHVLFVGAFKLAAATTMSLPLQRRSMRHMIVR